MTLSREAMLELMAYADDELDGDARARVEELLRTSDEARGVIDAMGTLGEVVRQGVEARGASASAADAIADGVMAAIAREPAGVPAKVVSLEGRRPRAGAITATIAVLALAAGAVFFIRSKAPAPVAAEAPLEPAPSMQPPPPSVEAPPAVPSAAVAQAEEPPDQGVDLEEVHSTKNKVNVYFVAPSAAGAAASVVVWIDDRHGTR